MVNLFTRILDCDSYSPALLDLLLSFDTSIWSAKGFPSNRKLWSCCCLSFHWFSIKLKRGCTMDYSRADLDGLHDHLRDILLGDIFKCGASTAASELCEWVQLGIDVYIPHRKYQIMRHSFSWFSAACTAVIAHIFSQRTFFCLYQQNLLNLKFRQLSNYCKNILEAVQLPYANETKSLSLSWNLALSTFGVLVIVFSTKVNLLYLLYSIWLF